MNTRAVLRTIPTLVALFSSTVLVVLGGATVPAALAMPLFVAGVAVVVLLVSGRAEGPAARVLVGAREPHGYEVAALKPVFAVLDEHLVDTDLDVRVDGSAGLWAARFARRTLVLSGGLADAVREGRLDDEHAAAVVAHAVGLSPQRFEPAVRFWSMPWTVLRGLCVAVSARVAVLPLVCLAWRLRFVTGAAAAVQGYAEGHLVFGLLTAGIVAVTYLLPWCQRREQRMLRRQGDRFVIEHGLGAALADVLRPAARDARALQRVHELDVAGRPFRRDLTLVPTGAVG